MSDVILNTARAVMALMQPLTGTRATGTVTMTAKAGQSFELKPGTYAFPVLSGKVRPHMHFKVAAPPSGDAWTITDAGVAVTFISNLGGAKYNIPGGTVLRMDPPIEALDTAVVAGDFIDGVDATGFGALKDVVIAEQLEGPVISLDMRRAPGLTRFPAAVITWDDGLPADGSTQTTLGRGNRVGTRSLLWALNYQISIISSRADSDHARRHEGMYILNAVARLISDRHMVDTECVSNPQPLQLRQMLREDGPQDVYQKFYIYHLMFGCTTTLESIDTRTYPDWLKAVLNVNKPQNPALPNQGDLPLVVDNEIDMS